MNNESMNTKRVAIILALELAIIICLSILYDMPLESPDLVVRDEQTSEIESQVSGFPNTEIVGVGSESATEEETEGQTEPTTESETEPEASEEPEIVVLNENPLTGLYDVTDGGVGKRPVAVMINNINKAMPQYGTAKADVIFEIPVEGFATRLMAMYADYTQMPKICSIRSCRPYFPAIAKGFDAVYVYSGLAEVIRPYVNSLELTEFHAGRNYNNIFARDMDRRKAGYALEHTLYFDATKIVEVMEQRKMRSDLESDNQGPAFKFQDTVEPVRPDGEECTWIKTNFGAATATLIYNVKTNSYYKELNDKPQIDYVEGVQLSFTNVFILETTIKSAEYYELHKDVDWHGGTGYYISNGARQAITWSKKDEASPMKFYDMEGNELRLNRGKTYIAINRKNRTEYKAAITAEMVR